MKWNATLQTDLLYCRYFVARDKSAHDDVLKKHDLERDE